MNDFINPEVVAYPKEKIIEAAKKFPTPFFIYDEKKLRENCRLFRDAFRKYFPDFSPLYAIKANANPVIIKIIAEEGYGADCSSESEAWICHKLGIKGMYTGNYTTSEEFKFISDKGMIFNLDDVSMLETVSDIGMPETLSFRINPGISNESCISMTAGPKAKYGVPFAKAAEAYQKAKDLGVKHFGIHMMTGTNVPTNEQNYFTEIVAKLFDIIIDIKEKTGIEIEFMNIGGGFGVPYRPEEKSLDLDFIAKSIREVFDKKCAEGHISPPKLMAEPGRFIAANAGWLIGKVHVIKDSYKKFAGIDAGGNDMPRPMIYGAYHHISILNKEIPEEIISITGRICENSDQFAIDRNLPKIDVGDIVVIHNCGAHAYAMGNNYNGRPRSSEYLIESSENLRKIRNAETIEDLYKNCIY